ncbi:hypothetical protein [Pectinatus frisingensis]|uniref:hypothetical protein n=1 Tax=Pectinatus frisingensis TaxID=865 RepID=UPI0018C510D9|nr:hypothetical protein [Pectinatus frisingensis]
MALSAIPGIKAVKVLKDGIQYLKIIPESGEAGKALKELYDVEKTAGNIGHVIEVTAESSKVIFKAGKTTIEDIAANPKALSGKSAEEVAQMLREAGYDVTVQASKKSTSGAQIIKINNPGEGRNITQVQVSPGGGRHGANPYVKISTSDQGIIKIVDGVEDIYKTDGVETAKIIFTGGK